MDVREKLIEILKQAPFEGKVLDEWWWEEKIKRIADHLISNGVTVQEWISVKDRLPDNGQEVLISYVFPLQHRIISKYFYSASIYHTDDGGGLVNEPHFENEGFRGMRVTHWMPLPPPPKGE